MFILPESSLVVIEQKLIIKYFHLDKIPKIDLELLKKSSEAIQSHLALVESFLKPLKPWAQRFSKELKAVPESNKILAEYGWYLPLDFKIGTAIEFAKEVKNGNITFVDNKMIGFIDEDISAIEFDLINKFPHRSEIFKQSFTANKNQQYYLSIPVFFTQIEGICKELTGLRFFKLRENDPATSEWTKRIDADSILQILLEPMKLIGSVRQKQDPSNPIGINRHDVLHGDSFDYGGNEMNSYKSLSLLNYIAETVYLAKKHIDRFEKISP